MEIHVAQCLSYNYIDTHKMTHLQSHYHPHFCNVLRLMKLAIIKRQRSHYGRISVASSPDMSWTYTPNDDSGQLAQMPRLTTAFV